MLKPACSALLLVVSALICIGADDAPSRKKEPAAPVPVVPADGAAETKPAPAPPSAPAIKHLGGARYELNGISFNEATRSIRLPALVNMTRGLIEYALVHEEGKAHESLLSTKISPYDLNVVLLLLNYQPSTTFFDFSDKKAGAMLVKDPKIAPSSQLAVAVEWKDAKGALQTARLEALLLNGDQKAALTSGPFIYTGSMLMDDGTFMAKETGSILALYTDPASLINNPRAGNDNDDAWLPNTDKLPLKDTPVTVIIELQSK